MARRKYGQTLIFIVLGICLVSAAVYVSGQVLSQGLIQLKSNLNVSSKPEDKITPLVITPTTAKTSPPPQKAKTSKYNIDYYELDKATNKALASEINLDSKKKSNLEDELDYIKISPNFINQYAIVFSSYQNAKPGTVFGIFRNGKQVLIQEIQSYDNGIADYFNKNIVLNNDISGEELKMVLVHEIGHIVSSYLNAEEFKTFMQKRNLPSEVVNSWYNFRKNNRQGNQPLLIGQWNASPEEDFAEVFKYIYGGPQTTSSLWNIRTNYGTLNNDLTKWFKDNVSAKFQ